MNKKIRNLIILAIIAVILVVVAIVMANGLLNKKEVEVINQAEVTNNETGLDGDDIASIERAVRTVLKLNYNNNESVKNGEIKIAVRPNSMEQKSSELSSLIVDIEELKISYEVLLVAKTNNVAYINCVKAKDMKYDNKICIGEEGNVVRYE
jgi:hypothetical protein